MAQTLWPIEWPQDVVDDTSITDQEKAVAELWASQILHHLTAQRIGIVPVTVMPCGNRCKHPRDMGDPFHPVLLDTGQMANCFCHSGCQCDNTPRVRLDAPVGHIISVTIDGEDLPSSAYRVINGRWLERVDGQGWPSCSGDRFTVTYSNSYAPDQMGRLVGGFLAREYLKLLSGDQKNCRLPEGVTSVARAGVTMEFETGLFPGNLTGIPEVDTYLIRHNPHALKVQPKVYSVDKPRNNQVTWKGLV